MAGNSEYDTIVIGGGMVGMSIAYGLVRGGERVLVLDQGDDAFRAARGNFGLVWVQGKGIACPAYARWSMAGAKAWPSLAANLHQQTGIDVQLSQIGGLDIYLDADQLAARAEKLRTLADGVGEPYPFKVLDPAGVRELCPEIGPDVVGAIFTPMDGHVSPLRLLRALVQAFSQFGGKLRSGADAGAIAFRDGVFAVTAGDGRYTSGKLVLAAGLGNRELAPLVGLSAPVVPNRGQILVTERLRPFLAYPTGHIRQTGDGGVQIGDSKEDVGFDDGTSHEQLARMARQAERMFPVLASANIIRTWGALRVMTPDGFPIYQASTDCPGAFVVTCHSGVTLAARHAGVIADWIRGGPPPDELGAFSAERFHV